MKKDYFRKFKEQDFVRAYEDELKSLGTSAPYVSRDDVILRALHSGKGRYYISFEEAARNVRRIMNRLAFWLVVTSSKYLCIRNWHNGWQSI